MTMTVGARSLDNEERSNFRDYMSLLSLSVDASMTVREVMAVAYLIGRHDALRDVRNASSPARTVNRRLIHGGPSDCVFNRGYEAGAGMVSDEIDALMRDVEAKREPASAAGTHPERSTFLFRQFLEFIRP